MCLSSASTWSGRRPPDSSLCSSTRSTTGWTESRSTQRHQLQPARHRRSARPPFHEVPDSRTRHLHRRARRGTRRTTRLLRSSRRSDRTPIAALTSDSPTQDLWSGGPQIATPHPPEMRRNSAVDSNIQGSRRHRSPTRSCPPLRSFRRSSRRRNSPWRLLQDRRVPRARGSPHDPATRH